MDRRRQTVYEEGALRGMAGVTRSGTALSVETDSLAAAVHTEGYVSGVAAGTLVDKRTGGRELGFGVAIADFLLEPGWEVAPH
jgi:hypothetical protein